MQTRPQGFLLVKMAVGETPGQSCQSGSKIGGISSRKHDVSLKIARQQTRSPDAGNNLRKHHFIVCHVIKYFTIRGVFQQPWPGVSPTTILNKEKALGTRLSSMFHLRTQRFYKRETLGMLSFSSFYNEKSGF